MSELNEGSVACSHLWRVFGPQLLSMSDTSSTLHDKDLQAADIRASGTYRNWFYDFAQA